jgi:DNA-binding transcriptional LysR family regulator
VLNHGSLSGAARALGGAQPTIGRHVAALEKSLRLALFTRSQTGFLPTEAGQSLRMYAESLQSTVAALERAAASQGSGVRGSVRVTASDVIGVEVLPPIVARLRDQYPDLAVELALTDRVQDLIGREADIAVRMMRPRQELLVARRVGQIALGMHAHQNYLSRHGTPKSLADLANHALIGFDEPTAFIRSAGKTLSAWRRGAFSIRTDNNLAQLALIRSGAGIGVCQVAIAHRDDKIVRILPKQIALSLETWVTMHQDLRNSPRCRVTFDALVEGLEQYIHSNRG